jgi:DNA-binding NarL/FixJ family response regulator
LPPKIATARPAAQTHMNLTEHTTDSVSHSTPARRILIVDDHPVFRHGLSSLIGLERDLIVCGEAENAPTALDAMRRLKPDAAIVDISMPGTNGIELTKFMLAEQPQLAVLIVSIHSESLYALRALRAGAKGYVMKHQSADQIIEAIRQVLSGSIYVSPEFGERLVFRAINSTDSDLGLPVDNLSERELEILRHYGRGLSTRQIAETLHLSIKTVETHRAHIKKKLGIQRAQELMTFAEEWLMASGEGTDSDDTNANEESEERNRVASGTH